jgi:hypothetical protein
MPSAGDVDVAAVAQPRRRPGRIVGPTWAAIRADARRSSAINVDSGTSRDKCLNETPVGGGASNSGVPGPLSPGPDSAAVLGRPLQAPRSDTVRGHGATDMLARNLRGKDTRWRSG